MQQAQGPQKGTAFTFEGRPWPWQWGFWPFPFLSCLQSHESREEMLRVRDREAAWEMIGMMLADADLRRAILVNSTRNGVLTATMIF